MGFREHGVMIYLDKILYRGFIRLQADYELGRSYAALLPFNEGLYTLGFLSKEDYIEHRKRYSEKLLPKKDIEVVQVLKPKKKAARHLEDYSRYSLEELHKKLEGAKDQHDVVATQFIAFEIKKRSGAARRG